MKKLILKLTLALSIYGAFSNNVNAQIPGGMNTPKSLGVVEDIVILIGSNVPVWYLAFRGC